jgi:N-acetylneuraminate synthase/N,N'-diacetyllegionaminate synthase
VFVIAEIGVNHNGDAALARKMIDAAARAGADCVKFQTFRAEEFMADREMTYEYISAGRKVREKMFDMFKRLELPDRAYRALFAYARKRGVEPMTSAADPLSLAVAVRAGAPALKLSSEDLINLPLVELSARSRLPLILSTGMADAEEVQDALAILARRGVKRAVFLHCVSVYPTPDREANLNRILALRALTAGPVGYSDHTLGVEACTAAVALGACVIEKHFTLDRGLPGPDQALSSTPGEFAALVRALRRVESMRGHAAVTPATAEAKSRRDFRRSLVAASDLPPGHRLSRADLLLKRPGTGLRARDAALIVGKRLRRAVAADKPVLPRDVR